MYHPNDSWGLEGPLQYFKKKILESRVMIADNFECVFLKDTFKIICKQYLTFENPLLEIFEGAFQPP